MPRNRVVLAGAAVVLPLLLVAPPAAAHVTIHVSSTEAGSTSQVRLEVPHGCAGSATTELAVRMPAGVSEVVAETTERWSAEAGADAVTYRTDEPLPDGSRDEVAFSVRLPDDVGAVLVFPVVQRCEEGEAAWTEVAADEASRDALEQPAPVVVVTARDGGGRVASLGAAGLLAAACLTSGAVLALRRRRG